MTRTQRLLVAACCLFLGLAGCSDDPPVTPTPDSGVDAGAGDAGGTDGGPAACDSNPCGDNSTCTVGANDEPVCGCVDGYVRIDDACERDICAVENGGCHPDAVCTPSVDNEIRTCTCKTGYIGNGVMCRLDVCANNADCGANAICEVKPGDTHACACEPGYIPNDDGKSCYRDWCAATFNGGCPDHSTCSNSPDGAVCTCDANYEKDGENCVPKRPCDPPTNQQCGQNESCHNQSNGTFLCKCSLGFERDPSSGVCVPYDPCVNTECPLKSTCSVDENFVAQCTCNSGYKMNDAGDACENVDECAANSTLCPAEFDCEDRVGSYECVCKEGTIGDLQNGCRPGYLSKPAAGQNHVCAIATDSTLWCWGQNSVDSAQLGQPTTTTGSSIPMRVGTASDWLVAEAGANHTCAVKKNGQLWCWGLNNYGQIGNGQTGTPGGGSFPPVTTPTRVIGNWGDVISVAAGRDFTCAIRRDTTTDERTLWCWGYNFYGQLGNGQTNVTTGNPTPGQVGTDTDWAGVTAGDGFACGVKTNGRAYCWGDNAIGQLGVNDTNPRTSPTQVAEPEGATMSVVWSDLSAYGSTACGLASGEVYCWGNNNYGQVSSSVSTELLLPTLAAAGPGWTDVAAGEMHSCGILNGEAWCWGYNIHGQASVCAQVGSQLPPPSITPPVRVGTETDWEYIGAGRWQSCGARQTGEIWCWGSNQYGQLGNASLANSCVPVATR